MENPIPNLSIPVADECTLAAVETKLLLIPLNFFALVSLKGAKCIHGIVGHL